MFELGPEKLLVLLVIAATILGPKKLPEIGRSLGRAIREFRRSSSEDVETSAGEPPGSNPSTEPHPNPEDWDFNGRPPPQKHRGAPPPPNPLRAPTSVEEPRRPD